jgi:leucyl/phenylalanyl-tRNA---protein transferase
MGNPSSPVPWLSDQEAFPPVSQAWGASDPAPGLLAAGGTLDLATLTEAYSQGIFPWFSAGQPVLWWSPDPRMVLETRNFRLHRSLRKTLVRFQASATCEIRFDGAFDDVIRNCSAKPREGQIGTWIVPEMIRAYRNLHRAGHAHSVEAWMDGELAGGLYCVSLGRMVYGESMFAHRTDASKIALAALVGFCLSHDIRMIDCQQNTRHLASLGAFEIDRTAFLEHVAAHTVKPPPRWVFSPVYWNALASIGTSASP